MGGLRKIVSRDPIVIIISPAIPADPELNTNSEQTGFIEDVELKNPETFMDRDLMYAPCWPTRTRT